MPAPRSPFFFWELVDPIQLVTSGVLILLLFTVFGFGIRHRNDPMVSMHCILLALILSLALWFAGQYFANRNAFFAAGVVSSPEDPAVTAIRMGGEFLIASRLAAGQALFGLVLTAILVLLRARGRTSPAAVPERPDSPARPE